jgi:HprK-related kinase B
MRRHHLLLHASGVSRQGRTVALGGPAGAGKSTAALHLVEAGFRFLSNDRVLVRPLADRVEARGYPKRPRVNPGTLLHHPRLRMLLRPDDRETLTALAPEDLWALERKCDVDLDAIYGPGTVELTGTLHALMLLKWRLGGERTVARRLDPAEALANVPFVHKDLGVFDLRPERSRRAADRYARYADVLGRLTVIEVTGRVDFRFLADAVAGCVDR